MRANNRQHQPGFSAQEPEALLQASPHADCRVEAAAESTFTPCTIDGSECGRDQSRFGLGSISPELGVIILNIMILKLKIFFNFIF